MLTFAENVTESRMSLSMRRFAITASALALCGSFTKSNAQQAGGVIVDVESCLAFETRERQLECYEERVHEVLRASKPDADADANAFSNAVTTSASDATVEPESSRSSRRAERREAREAERRQREAAEAAEAAAEAAVAAAEAAAAAADPSYAAGEIVATITAFDEILPDAYQISLDNGQVWRQTAPKRYPLLVGAEVRLRPGGWGPSYRLTDPNVGNFIQVRRVQ